MRKQKKFSPSKGNSITRKISAALKTRLKSITQLDNEKKILLLSIIIYTFVMASFSIMRMYALKSSAWDLGNYNQAMYTFVFEGKLFYLTPELQNNPNGSLFGIHFSPIFFLQAPLYLIYPGPEILLILQSFTLAVGVVPTYLISREYFESRKIRLLLCSAYLLNPAILGINVFDFHPEMYIPTFYLFMVYFYIKHNWKGTWVFSLLLMSTIEFAPTLTFLFGIFFFLKDVAWTAFVRKKKPVDRKLAINLVVLIIVSVIWLFAALRVISYFSPNVPLTQGKTELWSTLGASNLAQVPITAFTNPSNALNALLFDGPAKISYLVVSSVSWMLLPLFSVEFWFLSLSWLFPALLSSNNAFYTIGLHYPSFFAGQLTYAGILMLRKFSKFRIDWQILASFILLGTILSNPFLSLNVDTNPWAGYGFPTLSEKALAVNNLMTLLPPTASVLANQNIFPLVSSRSNAYTIPWQINYDNTISFSNYTFDILDKVDYLIIDTDHWKPLTAVLLSKTDDFGVLGFQNNVLLLKRGYKAEPEIFERFSYSFHFDNLDQDKNRGVTLVPDASSPSGYVLKRSFDAPLGTDFSWSNAYEILIPGEYSVTFWIKMDQNYSGSIGRILKFDHKFFPIKVVEEVRLDMTGIIGHYETFNYTGIGSAIVYNDAELSCFELQERQNGELKAGTKYYAIRMNITVTAPGNYEFRAVDVTLPVTIYLDKIDLELSKVFAGYAEPVNMITEYYLIR